MIQADTNTIYLTGELNDEPSYRELKGGLPVANVKLAVVSRFLSTNEKSTITLVNLVFYGPAVELIKPLRAGARVYVQGELIVRSTSATPTVNRTTTEVVVRVLHELREASNASAISDPSTWS